MIERVSLAGIVAVGVGLRAFRLGWGLPAYNFPDAMTHFIGPAMAAAAGEGSGPKQFVHPPVVFLVLTAVFRLWSLVTGEPIRMAGAQASGQIAALDLTGRIVMVAIAGLTLIALHAVGRRLVREPAALLATACFALAPLPVLETHRIGPDVPMLLLAVLATLLALPAPGSAGAWRRLGSFGVGGLAAATKYTTVFVLAVPLATTLRERRWWLVAAGCAAAALGFALGCAPCWWRLDDLVRSLRLLGSSAYVVGMPGVDLALGWTQHRFVYPLVVALPFMLGWPVYLAALAGLVFLWRTDRSAALIVLAGVVPYFVFMGGAISAVPRYYLLLAPFLALAAGALLARLATGTAGRVVVALVLLYTAAFTVSQVVRLGLGPQRAVGALVQGLVTEAASAERRVVVAYPNRIALRYDPVRSFVRVPGVEIVDFPERYGHLAAEPPRSPDAGEVVAETGAWLTARRVDVVVLPSWVENAVLRGRPAGFAGGFFRALAAGELGFRLAGDFRTRAFTEALYTWGDPMLDTHWESGIVGYKVFVRDAASAGPSAVSARASG